MVKRTSKTDLIIEAFVNYTKLFFVLATRKPPELPATTMAASHALQRQAQICQTYQRFRDQLIFTPFDWLSQESSR